jgi:hypothetical protein
MFPTLGLALPNRDALLERESRRAQLGEAGLRRDIQYGEDLANLQAQEALRSAQTLTQEPGMPTGMAIPTAQAAQPAPAAAPAAAPKAGLQATMAPAASAAAAQTDKLRAASRKAAKQQGEQAWPELGTGTGTDMLTYPLRLGATVGSRLFPAQQSDEERRVAETRRTGAVEKSQAPRSVRNNNPGNIEFGDFARSLGATGSDGRFAIFPDAATGQAAQAELLRRYGAKGFNTVEAIVNRWSPQADPGNAPGSTNNYARFVAQRLGVQPNQPLDMNNPQVLSALAGAMAQFEGGTRAQAAAPAQPATPAAGIPTQQAAAPAAPQFAPVAMPEGYMGLPPREMAVAQQRLQQIQAMFNATRDPAQRAALMGQYQQLQDSVYETQLTSAAQRASAGDEQSLSSLAQAAQQYIVRTGDGRYALATQDRATGQFIPNPNQVGTAQEISQYLLNQASATRRAAAQALATKQQEELIKAQGAGARAAAELPAQIKLEQVKLNTAIQQEIAKAEAMGRRPANVVALKDNIGNTTGAIIVYNDGSYKQVGGGEQTTDGGMRVVQ